MSTNIIADLDLASEIEKAASLIEKDSPKHFDTFSKLPKSLVPASLQVMKFSGNYVKLQGDNKYFDWTGFKNAIDGYKEADLTFDKYKTTVISQTDVKVSTMVERIVKFLLEALAVIIDPVALKATIEATFTNLKEKKSRGWADFNTSREGSNSSWEYRVVFAVTNPDLADYFYSLVTTIKLEANIKEETGWWGLTGESMSNFSATIDAIQLIVEKGFKAPS